MKLVHLEDVPETSILSPRQGVLRSRQLVQGEDRTSGNFSFQFDSSTIDRFSPRHRHNFDQFRYQIDGFNDFGRNGRMTARMLGYFPECAFYGPQNSGANSVTVVLQFGGASGEGYMSNTQKEYGITELKKIGVFDKGVFRRNEGVPGKKNMDGYQAVWEFVNKRPMVYRKPRYRDPVLVNSVELKWMPVDGAPGIHEKLAGVFTERRIHAAFLRFDSGAAYRAEGRRLFFILDGTGTAADGDYRRHTTLFLDSSERASISARTATEILLLGLPEFDTAAAARAA